MAQDEHHPVARDAAAFRVIRHGKLLERKVSLMLLRKCYEMMTGVAGTKTPPAIQQA
jgi:hypothetical protein